MNIIIITGASSGMGKEAAKQLDKIYSEKIDEFWLISRREEKLTELSFSLTHKCRIIPMDITNQNDVLEFELLLSLVKPNIIMLVNAAGYGIVGRFDRLEAEEQAGMIRLNCEALTNITRISLDYMHRGARIIQFASSASFVPQAGFNVYSATKAYVLSFSRALNQELKPRHISVTAVCPGPVNTDFFIRAEKHGNTFNFKKYFMSDPVDVVWKALYDSYKRHSISIYSASMNIAYIATKFLPHDLILNILAKFK